MEALSSTDITNQHGVISDNSNLQTEACLTQRFLSNCSVMKQLNCR